MKNVVVIELDRIYEAVLARIAKGDQEPGSQAEAQVEMTEIFAELYPDLPPPPLDLCKLIYMQLALKGLMEVLDGGITRPDGVTLQ